MIKKVHIEHFTCLDNIDVETQGRHVFLLGDNEVGKSSFIRFIKIALGSNDIPTDAMGSGYIIKDRGGKEWTFKVKIKGGKSVVTIVTPEGLEDSKKTSLANIIGANSFDIDEFVRLSETTAGKKKQVEIFKQFLPQETRLEIEKYEGHLQVKYNERTEINKDIKDLQGEVNNHPMNMLTDQKLAEHKEVSIADLTKKKDKVRDELNQEYLKNKAANEENRKDYGATCDKVKLEVEAFNKLVDKHTANHTNAQVNLQALVELGYPGKDAHEFVDTLRAKILDKKTYVAPAEPTYIQEIPSDAPIKQIDEEILQASETNKKYEQAQTLIKKRAQLATLKEQSGEMDALIASSRQAIQDAIRDMDSPVEGLSFDDEKLLYNGIAVEKESLSTSTIMELGVKLKMAENKELGIIFLERGESLGKKRMEELFKMANDNGFQIIMEKVVPSKEQLEIELVAD